MSDDKQTLTGEAIDGEGLADWRFLLGSLHARFSTGSFATGLSLVNQIGAAAEEMNHHPDLDLRYPLLNIKLTSHDVGGVTQRDIRLARTISGFAAAVGVSADPSAVSVLEIGLDAADHAAVRPFWAAVLGMKDVAVSNEVVDADGALPTIWFQETETHEEPRQRFHLDITVSPEVAPGRIEAALAAGGTLVTDENAPSFWVLADAEGNKACVCTWQGRGGS